MSTRQNNIMFITKTALEVIEEEAIKNKSKEIECGGSLIGFSIGAVSIILYALRTGAHAIQNPSYLATDDTYQCVVFKDICRKYPNTKFPLQYLGDHHLHPLYMPTMSALDKNTCKKILCDPIHSDLEKLSIIIATFNKNTIEYCPFFIHRKGTDDFSFSKPELIVISEKDSIIKALLEKEYVYQTDLPILKKEAKSNELQHLINAFYKTQFYESEAGGKRINQEIDNIKEAFDIEDVACKQTKDKNLFCEFEIGSIKLCAVFPKEFPLNAPTILFSKKKCKNSTHLKTGIVYVGLLIWSRNYYKKQEVKKMKIVIDERAVQEIKGSDCISGPLFGREMQEENLIQIVNLKITLKHNFWHEVGRWHKEAVTNKGVELLVNDDGLKCFIDGEEVNQVEVFNMQDYNARNRSEVLSQRVKAKKALLVSCGSVNSRIGYELVKHGIDIAITDPDHLDIANPYRWGIQNLPELFVGRAKTMAFKDAVLNNIPDTKVKAYTKDFCKDIAFFDQFTDEWKPDLIIIATDTEDSRRDVNWLSHNKGIPALYIGLADKAESGQIIYISGKKQDPCYMCFKGKGDFENPTTTRATNKQYGIDECEQRSVPALSIDVNIISDIATKLAMVILASEDVSQYFKQFDNKGDIMWFSTKPDTWVLEDFAQKLIAKIQKDPKCVVCGGGKP